MGNFNRFNIIPSLTYLLKVVKVDFKIPDAENPNANYTYLSY